VSDISTASSGQDKGTSDTRHHEFFAGCTRTLPPVFQQENCMAKKKNPEEDSRSEGSQDSEEEACSKASWLIPRAASL
jgi:hypothetical protein